MNSERLAGRDGINRRADGILDARETVKKTIWSYVPNSANAAFSRISGAVYAGVDIDDPVFISQEEVTIRLALPAIRAKLEQSLVDRVMFNMLDRNNNSPGQSHVIELFPPQEPDEDPTEPSVMDFLKDLPEKFADTIPIDEQTRQIISSVLVVPDRLALMGLHRAELYSAITVGDSNIISVPTFIPGVDLRYRNRQNPVPVVEFVMDAL